MSECKYKGENGRCKKYGSNGRLCKPSTRDWCDYPIDMIDDSRMCEMGSIFGNDYCYITESQLKELIDGKVICVGDEYGTFILLRKDTDDDQA